MEALKRAAVSPPSVVYSSFNIIYNKNSPTSAGSEMNCRSEHKCSKEFYKQKKKTLVRVLELYYNNKKRTYCSKNDD